MSTAQATRLNELRALRTRVDDEIAHELARLNRISRTRATMPTPNRGTEAIIIDAASAFGVSTADVLSARWTSETLDARSAAVWTARKLGLQATEIASLFDRASVTFVTKGCKRVEDDPDLKARATALLEKLRQEVSL